MSLVAGMDIEQTSATESAYVVRGDASPDAITTSLQSLLPTRHRPIVRQRFTLLDTFDGRVRRAGARVTQRGVNGTSTVGWQTRRGESLVTARLKHTVNFAWDLPEGPLQRVLAPVIGVRRLLAQADAEEYGSLLEILDGRGKTIARLWIESGRARLPRSGNTWQPLPTVITLTGLRGYDDVYERLVPVILSRPGIESCPEGLDGLILRQVGAPERGNMSSPRVDLAPAIRADVGARRIHLALLGILMANEPGVRANLDTEFLHDFRVAIRRTRSLLRQIKHVFPTEVVEHFSTGFSWVGRLTGPPRDLDVLILALREKRAEVSAGDLKALTGLLSVMRQREHDRVVEALDSARYRRLVSEWKAFLERPAPAEPEVRNAYRRLVDVVSQRAWRLSRRIARSAKTIDERTAPERLHEVRIDAKKLRYLIDITTPFYDAADLERILDGLKKLQRVLGDFNDAVVQEKRLLDCGETVYAAGRPASALLTLGRLAEQSRQCRECIRQQVLAGLALFRADDTRSACRRAFKGPHAKGHV
jgi:CHAD domain-containing protein